MLEHANKLCSQNPSHIILQNFYITFYITLFYNFTENVSNIFFLQIKILSKILKKAYNFSRIFYIICEFYIIFYIICEF